MCWERLAIKSTTNIPGTRPDPPTLHTAMQAGRVANRKKGTNPESKNQTKSLSNSCLEDMNGTHNEERRTLQKMWNERQKLNRNTKRTQVRTT